MDCLMSISPQTALFDSSGKVAFKMPRAIHDQWRSNSLHNATLFNADCMSWFDGLPENSIHAIVTDPPYGIKEYEPDQLHKMRNGNGGVWRIPPSFDGNNRAPLPRFTALEKKDRQKISDFFFGWAQKVNRILKPGGHVIIATNAFTAPLLYQALESGGLEYRGQLIRLVRTMRGGDRPKNAEVEFGEVCSLPRGCFEPWGLFRKRLPKGMRVQDSLREFQTGGLRRTSSDLPFEDVIKSERTPGRERLIANHPSIKPQSFLRKVVHSALPLGEGVVLDPFMGSGSTIAAAMAVGYQSIGVELYPEYYKMALEAVPKLAEL